MSQRRLSAMRLTRRLRVRGKPLRQGRLLSEPKSRESRLLAMVHSTPIVFVVDDDVSVRESLKLLIESAGWQPETFGSGQEFLARQRVLAPSCLVLDVVLPDLNGCDLQKLVADRADMPII